MKLQVATQLIESGVEQKTLPQAWADLGAGDGLFTYALSTLLSKGSMIYAIDSNNRMLDKVRVHQNINLQKFCLDFVNDKLGTGPLDGILIANAIHFVKNKVDLLNKLSNCLKPTGRIVIVEYEMRHSNIWVPYPIVYNELSEVVKQSGFTAIKKLSEVPSVYENRMIYAALVSKR